jgi:hypothetical protein
MSVAIIQVPNRARMANGISKCLTSGIEYELLEDMRVEVSCADDVKLVKIIVAFGGKILSATNHKQITLTSLPKHSVQYARTNRKIPTPRK